MLKEPNPARCQTKKTVFIRCGCAAAAILSVFIIALSCRAKQQQIPVDTLTAESTITTVTIPKAIPAASNTVKTSTDEPNAALVSQKVYELVFHGKFSDANALLRQTALGTDAELGQLAQIVAEYEAISQKRRAERQKAYQEQIEALQKYENAADNNDVNDVNDGNDISKVFW